MAYTPAEHGGGRGAELKYPTLALADLTQGCYEYLTSSSFTLLTQLTSFLEALNRPKLTVYIHSPQSSSHQLSPTNTDCGLYTHPTIRTTLPKAKRTPLQPLEY